MALLYRLPMPLPSPSQRSHRLAAAAAALLLIGAACGVTGGTDATPAANTTPLAEPPTSAEPSPAGGLPEGPSALRDRTNDAFPEPLVDPRDIISGGPPPDGIPPIDDPEFLSITAADAYLEDDEPVVALEIDGDARAYPAQVLIWHEIVNDVVGGVPVSITYCPLCNSAATYVREVRGVETTFGTSGSLFASALVMYDRATESLWTHFDGRAVVGLLTGEQLETVPSPLLAWSDFKDAYPDGLVLDRDRTGFSRRYGANPYVGYDDPETFPFLFIGDPDTRAAAMQRVVGVTLGDEAKAYALEAVSGGEAAATHDNIGGRPIVVFWEAGQASALEDSSIAGGRDVGSVGVFVPDVDGQALTFSVQDGVFVDDETGSSWNVTGMAVSGPLAGSQLERLAHLDTFWFAWATYRPETELVTDL